MPEGYQTDWEAILEGRPEGFIASVSGWLAPPEVKGGEGAGGPVAPCGPVQELPEVETVLPTWGVRIQALNYGLEG